MHCIIKTHRQKACDGGIVPSVEHGVHLPPFSFLNFPSLPKDNYDASVINCVSFHGYYCQQFVFMVE